MIDAFGNLAQSMALKSAKESQVKALHEVAGWALITMLLMALMIASLYIWVRDFAGKTFCRGGCMRGGGWFSWWCDRLQSCCPRTLQAARIR